MAKNTTSRAEQVRARRTQRTKKSAQRKPKRTQKNAKSNVKVAPVFMRAGKAAMPLRPRKRTKTKRRYDLALGTSGAEIRLPAFPEVRVTWQWLSVVVLLGLSALMMYLWNSPAYRVNEVNVVGLERIRAHDVNMAVDVQYQSIFTIDPVRIRQRLEAAFPDLTDIEVTTQWPNSVVATVQERQPALVFRQNNATLWVDVEGVAFPMRGVVEGLPIIEAQGLMAVSQILPGEGESAQLLTRHQLLTPELVDAILAFHAYVPENLLLLYDADRGLGWKTAGGWNVYFGMNPTDVQTRIQIYEAIEAELQAQGTTPTLISVEYIHAPYYRTD